MNIIEKMINDEEDDEWWGICWMINDMMTYEGDG